MHNDEIFIAAVEITVYTFRVNLKFSIGYILISTCPTHYSLSRLEYETQYENE